MVLGSSVNVDMTEGIKQCLSLCMFIGHNTFVIPTCQIKIYRRKHTVLIIEHLT